MHQVLIYIKGREMCLHVNIFKIPFSTELFLDMNKKLLSQGQSVLASDWEHSNIFYIDSEDETKYVDILSIFVE